MLRSADLQFGVEGQRGAGRVGSRAALTPIRPGHEVHPFGLAACFAVTLDPQQGAVGVRHRDDDPGVHGVRHQQAADDGEDGGERM
jgi:hypothetical protein